MRAVLIFGAALMVIPCAAVMGGTEGHRRQDRSGHRRPAERDLRQRPELIIAFFALLEGLQEVVKASIVGSVIGNILLMMGAAMLVGGLPRDKQTFSGRGQRPVGHADAGAGGAHLPAIFQLIHGGGLPGVGEGRVDFGSGPGLSLGVSLILLLSYVLGLLFSLKTHRAVFNPYDEEEEEAHHWSVRRAAIYLAVSAVAVGLMSEILVGSISEASEGIGLSEFFVGVFIVTVIVGNAAEHWVAVLVAAKDKMDLAVNIAVGSSAQIALSWRPCSCWPHSWWGRIHGLVFNGYELGGLLFAVLIATW